MKRAFTVLFTDWETQIARPILVAVITAGSLLLLSLVFRPVRAFLFPVDSGYPLFCTAEGYAQKGDFDLSVDFYVVNPTAEVLTREKLSARLNDELAGTGASPDITLALVRPGRIASVSDEAVFNQGKGSLKVRTNGSRTVKIEVEEIQPYALLKATIVVAELPDRPDTLVTRGMTVPFNLREYHRACYSR